MNKKERIKKINYLQINLFRCNNLTLISSAFLKPNVFLARDFAEEDVLDRTNNSVLFLSPLFFPDTLYKFPLKHLTINNARKQHLNNFLFLLRPSNSTSYLSAKLYIL